MAKTFNKAFAYSIVFLLFFSLSILSVNADKDGTCKNPNPSGADYCGKKSGISNCYCDSYCITAKDCCTDYKEVCSASTSKPAVCVLCAAPPSGCKYDGGDCNQCGKIVCEGSICKSSNSLLQGDTKTFRVNNIDYEVVFHFVEFQQANFIINGETTKLMGKKATYTLSDKSTFAVSDFSNPNPNLIKAKASFCINGIAGTEKPVCGNSICEEGEADYSYCPPCVDSDPPCKAPCAFKQGTCPQDCNELKPTCNVEKCKPYICCKGEICPAGFPQGCETCGKDICDDEKKCTDSDGGKNEFVAGKTYTSDNDMHYDACYGVASVVEYYCSYDEIKKEVISCPASCNGNACSSGVCANGACAKPSSPPKPAITKKDVINWIYDNCNDNTMYATAGEASVSSKSK